uniref:IQ calmodulin-binding motif-containing protein n=1 Tax=Candidatus Kentrum sp. SD TaxID=2126332 RepID=A0A450Z870_9GAMM|nr:MAG: IQ calmodulin-binding motif-containing protein [Candidatus Kentron sp. SD]VFK49969.1 MAG: IQ calmodulin-binding motif-containing protein [Candidatus Kentron sp. SD]
MASSVVLNKPISEKYDLKLYENSEKSIVKIQTHIRGRLARKSLKNLKAEQQRKYLKAEQQILGIFLSIFVLSAVYYFHTHRPLLTGRDIKPINQRHFN